MLCCAGGWRLQQWQRLVEQHVRQLTALLSQLLVLLCKFVPACPLLLHRRLFVTKEALYPFTNGNTTTAGACNKARTANMGLEDKVQLTGSGFKQLKPWSAAALREVRGWGARRELGLTGVLA